MKFLPHLHQTTCQSTTQTTIEHPSVPVNLPHRIIESSPTCIRKHLLPSSVHFSTIVFSKWQLLEYIKHSRTDERRFSSNSNLVFRVAKTHLQLPSVESGCCTTGHCQCSSRGDLIPAHHLHPKIRKEKEICSRNLFPVNRFWKEEFQQQERWRGKVQADCLLTAPACTACSSAAAHSPQQARTSAEGRRLTECLD